MVYKNIGVGRTRQNLGRSCGLGGGTGVRTNSKRGNWRNARPYPGQDAGKTKEWKQTGKNKMFKKNKITITKCQFYYTFPTTEPRQT